MKEFFAKPCVGAIIERIIENETYILVQTREKTDGGNTNGLLELPAGKIREYEDIFSALRREFWEETGLTLTKIKGEESAISLKASSIPTISFEPFCITQNLSGAYSIILNTFLCEAEGTPVTHTNESRNIHWMEAHKLCQITKRNPEQIFFIHLGALRKYFKLLKE